MRRARGTFDAVAEFAAAIPVEVIGDLLLVPDADRAPLRGWSLAILGALEPALSDAAFERGEKALSEFHAYLRALIAERRAHPGDAERDVLTRLLQSAEPLSEDELVENCVFLLNAGHETTTNLIGNALELFARLRTSGGGSRTIPRFFAAPWRRSSQFSTPTLVPSPHEARAATCSSAR